MEALPGRLRRRLEADPALAAGWRWSRAGARLAVEAAPEATVTLPVAGVVTARDQVVCTCLLAPRCLHLAAVLLALPAAGAAVAEETPPAAGVDAVAVSLRPAQRQAAEEAWRAATSLLETGAGAADAVIEGELLRAAHSCRVASLPRLASASARVAERVRQLRAEAAEFRLDALAADLFDLLATARALLAAGPVEASWVGRARRDYRPVPPLRLTGLCSVPIVSADGFAGVVTYLLGADRRLWTVANVAPGGPARCAAAYREPFQVGDVAHPHLALGRTGLHVQGATGSADGRLGTGQGAAAVRAAGAAWDGDPPARLWAEPLAAQLDRAWAATDAAGRRAAPPRAGSELLFLRCEVAGVRENALVLDGGEGVGDLAGLAPSDHAELAYRANLRLLGCAPGLPLLVVGRVLPDRPRSLALLAAAPAPGGAGRPALRLPPAWAGRVNLGLDALQRAYVAGALPRPAALAAEDEIEPERDPLDALLRRVRRAVVGGRATLAEAAWSGVTAEEAALARRHMPAGAGALEALRQAAASRAAGTAGERRDRFALAWLAARAYQLAAASRLQRLAW